MTWQCLYVMTWHFECLLVYINPFLQFFFDGFQMVSNYYYVLQLCDDVALFSPFSADGVLTWHFMGLLSFFDPPRHDSKETLAALHANGVNVKMITGEQQWWVVKVVGNNLVGNKSGGQ